MKWLEVIELRSVGSHREMLESQLQKLLHQLEEEVGEQAVNVYRRVMIDSDLSIHLLHDSAGVEPGGSPLGLRLASSLKEFGLVNHSVWIEMFAK